MTGQRTTPTGWPVSKKRSYVVVSRRPGAAVVVGYPQTVDLALAECVKRRGEMPDARIGVYVLQPLGRVESQG